MAFLGVETSLSGRRWVGPMIETDRASEAMMQDTGLPVVIADDPLSCVARGCGRALEEMDSIGNVFAYDS